MAITVQPRGGAQTDPAGKIVRTHVEKGPYDDVLAAAKARPRGTLIPDVGYVLQWQISRSPGGLGVCSYSCADVTSEKWESNGELTDVFNVRNVQTQISLMRYCGPSTVNNAQWYDIRKWRAETDKALFDAWKYRDDSGEHTLSSFSQLLAAKIKLGYESVMRFYPVVSRVRVFPKRPAVMDIGAKLSYIDTPPEYDYLAAAWMKIQEDVEELSDGTFKLVESWQGADYYDVNFYGDEPDRWAFGSI